MGTSWSVERRSSTEARTARCRISGLRAGAASRRNSCAGALQREIEQPAVRASRSRRPPGMISGFDSCRLLPAGGSGLALEAQTGQSHGAAGCQPRTVIGGSLSLGWLRYAGRRGGLARSVSATLWASSATPCWPPSVVLWRQLLRCCCNM
jgi:hypothetical protein